MYIICKIALIGFPSHLPASCAHMTVIATTAVKSAQAKSRRLTARSNPVCTFVYIGCASHHEL